MGIKKKLNEKEHTIVGARTKLLYTRIYGYQELGDGRPNSLFKKMPPINA